MRTSSTLALRAAPFIVVPFLMIDGALAQSLDTPNAAADQPDVRNYGECPVAAINAAYRAAASRDGAETFALVAIEQDTLRQCIERSKLIAKLVEANNQIAQQIGIASADIAQIAAPAPQNCPPVEAASAPTSRSSADQTAEAPASETPPALVIPTPSPAVSCARGFEVVYTAGAGQRLTALIQRRGDQWHVSKGFKLPGGITVKAIRGENVIISEFGQDHVLPAAAAAEDQTATE